MSTCIFCKIVAGEIPSPRLAESEHAIAIRDIGPQAPFHALVLPRRHVQSLAHVTDATLIGDVMMLAAQVARDAGLDDGGYRVVLNTGDDGGQNCPPFARAHTRRTTDGLAAGLTVNGGLLELLARWLRQRRRVENTAKEAREPVRPGAY